MYCSLIFCDIISAHCDFRNHPLEVGLHKARWVLSVDVLCCATFSFLRCVCE